MLGQEAIATEYFGPDDIAAALKFPTGPPDWIKRVTLVMVAILLVFPGFGYGARVMRTAATEGSLPEIDDWWEMTTTGGRMGVALLVVGVNVGASGLFVALAASIVIVRGRLDVSADQAILLVGALVVFLVGIYLTPSLLANIAREDSALDGFDYHDVVETALTAEYATAWLVGGVVWIVGVVVSNFLTLVLVGLFLYAYVFIVAFYIWGRGFAAGLEARGVEY